MYISRIGAAEPTNPGRPRQTETLCLKAGKWRAKGLAVAMLAMCLPLLMPAPAATAGDVQWSVRVGSDHYGQTSGHHNRSGYQPIDYGRGDSRGYDRGYDRSYHRDYDRGGHHRGGYDRDSIQRVWVPPVYRTSYDDCGRSIRICVRAGYYRQVVVSTSYSRSSRDYSRRGQWGNRGSCDY